MTDANNIHHSKQPDHGPAPPRSCEEVLEDSILELISLGYQNGMTPDSVDWVLNKIIDARAQARRAAFKLHDHYDDDVVDDDTDDE